MEWMREVMETSSNCRTELEPLIKKEIAANRPRPHWEQTLLSPHLLLLIIIYEIQIFSIIYQSLS